MVGGIFFSPVCAFVFFEPPDSSARRVGITSSGQSEALRVVAGHLLLLMTHYAVLRAHAGERSGRHEEVPVTPVIRSESFTSCPKSLRLSVVHLV